MNTRKIERWVMEHAQASHKIYFRINGDIPVQSRKGELVFYELLLTGKRVLVLHPDHLTPVARICYRHGVQMEQA